MEPISRSTLAPWTTNSGWTRSAGESSCSRTKWRIAAVRRRRRGRFTGGRGTKVRLGFGGPHRNHDETLQRYLARGLPFSTTEPVFLISRSRLGGLTVGKGLASFTYRHRTVRC